MTSPAAMTEVGVLLGTAPYMSPEQAKGRAADRRSDVWAFGCVLYEMLAGRRAFDGEDLGDTLASVLRGEPDWDALPRETPPAMRTLLRRCLDKDRRTRVSDIAVALFILKEHASFAASSGVDPASAERHARELSAAADTSRRVAGAMRRWRLAAGALAILALTAAGSALWPAPPAPLEPLVRLDINLGPEVSLYGTQGIEVVISPDGNRIVYVSNNRLYTRTFDQAEGVELTGTEGGFAPFFSPDGRAIGFFADRQLKSLALDNGLVTQVSDTGVLPRVGSWGDNGAIVADMNISEGLSVVPATGGVPVALTTVGGDSADRFHRTPAMLPGSAAAVFTALTDAGELQLRVVSMADKRVRTVTPGASPRFVPASATAGFLLFVRGTTLFAARFRLDTLEIEGAEVPLLEQVAPGPSGIAQFDVSNTGRAVYQSGIQNSRDVVIQWLTPDGPAPLFSRPGVYSRISVSPLGARIAVQVGQGGAPGTEIWTYDATRDALTRLTSNGGELPRWSPDARHVAYRNPEGLYWIRSNGTGTAVRLATGQSQFPMSFTPDGLQVIFQQTVEGKNDLWAVAIPAEGVQTQPHQPTPVLRGPFDERQPAVSPDGKWLAYASDDTGEFQIYVRPFPNVDGGKWQVSYEGGGLYPIWSRTERRLFFRNSDNQVMSAGYTTQGDTFAAERPQLWSEVRLANLGIAGAQNFDLAPDGKRVAAIMPAPGPSGQNRRNQVVLLDNFLDELRRRVPAASR